MEAGIIAIVLLALAVGIVIGVRIGRSKSKKDDTQGTIYVYCDKPGSMPSLLLEYSVPIEDIVSRKRVTFDVDVVR